MKRAMNNYPFILSAFLCVSVSLCHISTARAETVDHSAFDAILKATVKDQRVDYKRGEKGSSSRAQCLPGYAGES